MRLEQKTPSSRPLSILVFGAGGHAREVAAAIRELGHNPIIRGAGANDPEWARVEHVTDVLTVPVDGWIVAIGDNAVRRQVHLQLLPMPSSPVTVVHPAAWVDPLAHIGDGTYVAAGAVVQIAHVGTGCIINTGAVVSHDCQITDFVHIAPRATLCGAVCVESFAFIGAGSVIKQGHCVGCRATVGCGAAVIRNVMPNTVVVGVPGRVLLGTERHNPNTSAAETEREVSQSGPNNDKLPGPGRGPKRQRHRKMS